MGNTRNQRLGLIFLLLVAVVGVVTIVGSILVGTTPLIPISAALSVYALIAAIRRLSTQSPAVGQRHIWLFASLAIGLFLAPVLFFALRQIFALGQESALLIALPIAVLIAWLIGVYGVRATNRPA
jgi:drug/metabolite transporter (DMT)-like permease